VENTESSPRGSTDSVAEVLKVKNSATDSILVARAREKFWKTSEGKTGDDDDVSVTDTDAQIKTEELTAKTPEDPSGTSDRKNFVVFSGQVNFGSDGVSVLTDLLDPRFDDFPLEVWYYSKFGEDIDKAPYYHRMYYEEFGAYLSGFTGPDDPEYIKTLGSIRNVNTNRRKGDDDISEGSPKHVSIMVKESPIVQLHVPNTIVNSSVTTRDEQAPHLINVTSWWTGTE